MPDTPERAERGCAPYLMQKVLSIIVVALASSIIAQVRAGGSPAPPDLVKPRLVAEAQAIAPEAALVSSAPRNESETGTTTGAIRRRWSADDD